jgi:preprotein translocase subunit YajC
MALMRCPECRNDVSDKAGACPKCGHPIELAKKKQAKTGSALTVIVIGVLIFLWMRNNQSSKQETQPSYDANPAAWVDARSLASQFSDNEVRADQRWKGKQVRMTGRVRDVGTEILGKRYVVLEGDRQLDVQCIFPRDRYTDYVAKLSKGDAVTLEGKCQGKVLMNVLVDECEPTSSTIQTQNWTYASPKKQQINALEEQRANGSITDEQFDAERAKIILAPDF